MLQDHLKYKNRIELEIQLDRNTFINILQYHKIMSLFHKMEQDIHREASATIQHSLFCQQLLYANTLKEIDNLRQSLKLGETYFRLRNYEGAYEQFLCAKSYAKTENCQTKINIFLMFSLLANQKVSEALKLLSKQQSSMIKFESLSTLQIYVKLGYVDRAFQLHKQIHILPCDKCRHIFMVQLQIVLIHCFDIRGMKQQAKEAYRFACQIMRNIQKYQVLSVYELFQQVYFLLFYGYRNNIVQFRESLLKLMKRIMNNMERQDKQACKFLKNQLEQGKEYDILLLSFDPDLMYKE